MLKTYGKLQKVNKKIKIKLVRMRGLEPPHLSAPEPKSGVSTNSTTSAKAGIISILKKNVTYSFDSSNTLTRTSLIFSLIDPIRDLIDLKSITALKESSLILSIL